MLNRAIAALLVLVLLRSIIFMTEMITLLKLTISLYKSFKLSLSSFLARSENTSQQLRQP
jgi:hypothetical protein